MSKQETYQEQIQFSAQQELKHLRTRCGKVYALGNNRFRAVVQTAQAHSPIATFADSANSAENAAGILDTTSRKVRSRTFRTTSACGSATRITTATA